VFENDADDVKKSMLYAPRRSWKQVRKDRAEKKAKEKGTWVEPLPPTVDTHTDVEANSAEAEEEEEEELPRVSLSGAIILLVITVATTVPTIEWLVSSIGDLTIPNGKVSKEWLGLILLPLLSGNTAERLKSVRYSTHDHLQSSIMSVVGSSIQITLFIIPLVILISWAMGKPLTLLFDPFECVTLFLTVLTLNYIVAGGMTHWLDGIILLHFYLLVGVGFWFYPGYDPTSSLLYCT